MTTNNKISILVPGQAPFFVRNDHQTFIDFVTAYYKFLEQANTTPEFGQVVERSRNLLQYANIDTVLDGLSEKLYDKFLSNFPTKTLADKTLILKHAKDFYRAKGTEKSFKFLMRAVYGQELSFYYPKKDILKVSDGKWYIQKSLRIYNTTIDGVANNNITGIQKFINHTISGNTSLASAIVESNDRYYTSGVQVDELILSGITGTFKSGEQIASTFKDDQGVSHAISSTVYNSVITSITIENPGSHYNVGDPVLIISSKDSHGANIGSGGSATVSKVATGNIATVTVIEGGAGYQTNNNLLITGGGGTGANAYIQSVNPDGSVHPNTYNIWITLVSYEANTPVNNTVFSNLNPSQLDPMNAPVINVLTSFAYNNTGPAETIAIRSAGDSYESLPTITVIANTRIRELGVLGRMVINHGGSLYAANDIIQFTNVQGGYGTAAEGQVTSVNATGSITGVAFIPVTGHMTGGEGYDINFLPTATVLSANGTGASISVTELLGTGGTFESTNTTLGAIQKIIITNPGIDYSVPPILDLSTTGDGTATAKAEILDGVFTYPGRYLNDDGQVSAFNFLQDRDYYQNFSYVVRVQESIDNYRQMFKELVHPAGMKMFGEYDYINENLTTLAPPTVPDAGYINFRRKTFTKTANTVNVAYTGQTTNIGDPVYLSFFDTNVTNGIYNVVSNANPNFITFNVAPSFTVSGNVDTGLITIQL